MVHGFLGVFAENFLVKANRIEPNGNFQIRMGTFKSIKITINNSQRWVLTKYAFFVFYTKIEVFRRDEQLLVVKCFQIQFLSWYAKIPTYSLSCRWVMYGGLLISWAPRREPRHHHQPFPDQHTPNRNVNWPSGDTNLFNYFDMQLHKG